MREPIREPIPEGRGPRSPEPFYAPGTGPVTETAPSFTLASLVEWAPIWGGMFVSLGVLFLLSSLGVAIGVGSGATAAGIWGAISLIIAFFVGGWFTGRTMTMIEGLLAGAHGLLMWGVTVIFTLVFAIFAGIAGASAISAYVSGIFTTMGVSISGPGPGAAAQAAVTSSWVTFLVLLLGVVSAVIGALVGNQGRFAEVRH